MKEPVTTLTDYILFVENLVLGFLLLKNSAHQTPVLLWGLAFLALAFAALAGGTYHGFPGLSFASLIWKATLLAIGVTSFLMLTAAFIAVTRSPLLTVFILLVALKFLFYAAWMLSHDDFKYVIYDYAPSMVLILILQLWFPAASTKWITSGIVLSFFGAAIQQSGFSLHKHFNFNDIYHVIQMAAMYLLYRGGLLLRSA